MPNWTTMTLAELRASTKAQILQNVAQYIAANFTKRRIIRWLVLDDTDVGDIPDKVVVTRDDQNRIVNVVADPRYEPTDAFVTSGGIPYPIEVGGDRFFLIQTEYVWPLNEQAELAFFLDVGDALFEDQNWGFETARVSTGVELRFHLPIFPVPLRLIYGWPIRSVRGDRVSNFGFSIGRSF